MPENVKNEGLHADKPSASSSKGYANRKELSAIAFERTRMPMVMVDARTPDQPIVLANASFLKLTGYSADEVIGRNCRILQGQDTSPYAVACIRSALIEERDADIELLNYRKNGEPFWNRVHVSPIYDDDGALLYFFGSHIDTTEERRIEALEASEHRLLKEVDHRAKNVMAIVESIVRLSNPENSALYASAIQHRVQALARVHAMLAEHGWQEIELSDVIREQVAPFSERRVSLEGPSVLVPPLSVQPLGLAIHELAVNAARHGSLSSVGGRLDIDWMPLDNGSIILNWTEDGAKHAQPHKSGFGTVLMNAMVESQLGGSIERSWRPEGLSVQLTMPMVQ